MNMIYFFGRLTSDRNVCLQRMMPRSLQKFVRYTLMMVHLLKIGLKTLGLSLLFYNHCFFIIIIVVSTVVLIVFVVIIIVVVIVITRVSTSTQLEAEIGKPCQSN